MTKGGKKNTQKRRSGKKHQTGGGLFDFLKSTPKPADANSNQETKKPGRLSWLFGNNKPKETTKDATKETQNSLTGNDETDKKTTNDTQNSLTGNVETDKKAEVEKPAVEPKVGGKRKNKTAKKPRKK